MSFVSSLNETPYALTFAGQATPWRSALDEIAHDPEISAIVAGVIALCTSGFQVLSGALSVWIPVGRGMTQFPIGYSSALVGAGYLIGIASGLAMLVGILIAWAGFVPFYTITSTPPDGVTMQKFAAAVYQERVRLIGAGAMGVAAIWTLITLALVILLFSKVMGSGAAATAQAAPRPIPDPPGISDEICSMILAVICEELHASPEEINVTSIKELK